MPKDAEGIQCNVISNEEPPTSHTVVLKFVTPTMHWPGETVVSVDRLPKCQHSYHSYRSSLAACRTEFAFADHELAYAKRGFCVKHGLSLSQSVNV